MKILDKKIKQYRANYKKLNESFSTEVIYPLTNRGFYSEINNLALAVLYCLDNNISIKVYSKKWVGGEWLNYFNPILEEYIGLIPIPASSIFGIKRIESYYYKYHKNIKKRRMAQGDIWNEMRSKSFNEKKFDFPELGLEGTIFDAKKQVLNLFLDYNEATIEKAFKLEEKTIDFIKESCGIHVRRGDKVIGKTKEADMLNIKSYINKAISIDPSVTKFTICTDDYSVIEDFKTQYPDYEFLTFCSKSKRGYSQNEFNNLSSLELKNNEVISILKDAYLLINSKIFIGTFSSNIGRYIVLERNNIECYSMDTEWHSV